MDETWEKVLKNLLEDFIFILTSSLHGMDAFHPNMAEIGGFFPLPASSTLFSLQQTIFYSMSFKRLLSIQCTLSAFTIEI
jgi:hypothetical protein